VPAGRKETVDIQNSYFVKLQNLILPQEKGNGKYYNRPLADANDQN